MDKICIYCKNINPADFVSREHVLPKSFGTFGPKTPTLHCVCDGCNTFFMKELDQVLARDTLEGVTRYKKGISSREVRSAKSLHFSLEETEENGEFGGAILGGYDPINGKPLPPVSQFWIKNIQTNNWERYKIDQIKSIEIDDEKYGRSTPGSRQMRIIAPSEKEHAAVVEELKKCGIPYREKERMTSPPFLKNVNAEGKINITGHIQGTIDKVRKRALVKVLFNFATYYIGNTETLKPDWDKARNFVRYNGETLSGRMSQKPFWTGQETKELRFNDDSYNLRVENQDNNVVGVIQLYNLFTYEFILVENYKLSFEKEIAYRFTPGQEPYVGIKISKQQ